MNVIVNLNSKERNLEKYVYGEKQHMNALVGVLLMSDIFVSKEQKNLLLRFKKMLCFDKSYWRGGWIVVSKWKI